MKAWLLGGLLLLAVQAGAHEAINADTRKAYLQKLDTLQHTAQTGAFTARAAALVEIGRTLDEVRGLLNEVIVSHGRTQGLETSILVDQLNAGPHPLQLSPRTRLYLANQRPYRDALAVAPRGPHASIARFMLLKNNFYDSFVDDPLRPFAQDKGTLLEMIAHGNALRAKPDPAIDAEEVDFILALHYLQAHKSGALPAAECERQFGGLLRGFRDRWPTSLKLATIEALALR
jgi:hypothetical protein